MTFHVGQKVVCIKEGLWTDMRGVVRQDKNLRPVKGGVYTITKIQVDHDGTFLILEGYSSAMWFMSRHFRPVKTTDISIFKAMLVSPPKQGVSA